MKRYGDMKNLTFIDLFASVGGFHLAFTKANSSAHCLFASEIDSSAQKTYHLNFPKTLLFGDITLKEMQDNIPQHFDILCAGFPCQAFSIAGHNVPIIKDDFGIRKLTPRECFNFQGYPKSFKLPNIANSKLYMQAGNSITYPLVKKNSK